jgi:hypothetical protein
MTVLTYEKYNKTKFAVRGDMEKHHSFVKSLNGRVNKRMKGGEGWLVDIKYEKELEEFVRNQNEESDNEQEEDEPVFRSENVYEERFDDDLNSGISTITEESENVEELHTEDDSSDESVFKELEERERMEMERENFEKERENFERHRQEQEKKYETERERERLELKRQKEEFERQQRDQEKEYETELERHRQEQEKKYETERERKRLELKRQKEEFERQQRDQEKEYGTEEKTDTHEIVENEDETVNHRENVNSTELQEMLEYYRKFSKPTKPKTDKNYLTIAKIINRLNTRVTKLEHKYQKLKRKYSDLKSNKGR